MSFVRPILYAISVSVFLSIALNTFLFKNNSHLEWLHCLIFYTFLAFLSGALYHKQTNAKTFVGIIMFVSIGRFLLASIAFFVYTSLLPFHEKSFITYFMTQYFIFACFEIFFLLKIVSTKQTIK